MALDSTIGGPNSDSYTSVDNANDYHNTRLHNEEWTREGNATKEKALKWATRLLDALPWYGTISDHDGQALRWPRFDVPDREGNYIDHDVMPKWLKEATAELAWLLIISDPTREADTKGFHMIKVGPITLQINGSDRSQAIYDNVMSMVNPYIFRSVVMERG